MGRLFPQGVTHGTTTGTAPSRKHLETVLHTYWITLGTRVSTMTTSVEGGSTMAANITNHTNLVNMSIKFFSDVLGKLRAFDGIMGQNTQHALGGVDFDSLNAYIGQTSHPPPTFVSLPGPWRFMTSAYAIALMAMVSSLA